MDALQDVQLYRWNVCVAYAEGNWNDMAGLDRTEENADKDRILPQAFLKRMEKLLGEEYGAFVESFGREKHQALRLNTLKMTREQCEEMAAACHWEGVPWAEQGYYYDEESRPGRHPYHQAGVYYIQEPSAMVPAALLDARPGERILDLCAAPGGKSTQIGAMLAAGGFLLCNEIHPARAKILSENIERMGIRNACVTNETPVRLAESFPEYFDRILVDAPCSGEGMFRKNQAACEEWSMENVAMCADRQDEILDCAAAMLRPGGRLVYSTCTFSVEENEGSVRRFVERHPEYGILPVEKERLGLSCCDGLAGNGGSSGGGLAAGESSVEIQPVRVQGGLEEALAGKGAVRELHLEDTVRVWPHRVKGEGHYAAVLQKGGVWTEGCRKVAACGLVKGIPLKEMGEYTAFCRDNLRTPEDILHMPGYCHIRFGDHLYLVPEDMPSMKGLRVLRPGLHLGELKKMRFEPSHGLALALSPGEVVHSWNLDPEGEEVTAYLKGQTFPAEGEKGWYLICVDGFSLGWGKLAGTVMKNHYPKGLRLQF